MSEWGEWEFIGTPQQNARRQRLQRVLDMRRDGLTFKQIGQELGGLTPVWARELYLRAMRTKGLDKYDMDAKP